MKKNNHSINIVPRPSSQDGFTLIELMVSLSLFIIVVLALVGSLYTVNDASRKVQAMRTVMDNISFTMESMSRTIRTGENITCSPTCSIASKSPGDTLIVESTLGQYRKVEYRWSTWSNGNGKIDKKSTGILVDPVTGARTFDLTDSTGWVAMTAPEIDIKKFGFYVDGISKTMDTKQPSVIIKMEGEASVPNGTPVPFAIQTYLSQRAPE